MWFLWIVYSYVTWSTRESWRVELIQESIIQEGFIEHLPYSMGYSRYSQYNALCSRRLHSQVKSNLSRIHNMTGLHVSRQCLWKWSPSFYTHEKVTPSRWKRKSRCHSANFTEEAGPSGYALAPEYLFCQHTEAWSHGIRSTAFFVLFIMEQYNSFSKLGNLRK